MRLLSFQQRNRLQQLKAIGARKNVRVKAFFLDHGPSIRRATDRTVRAKAGHLFGPEDIDRILDEFGKQLIVDFPFSDFTLVPLSDGTFNFVEMKPAGWLYEDELPEGYPYDAMFPHSIVDGVRLFPPVAAA